MEIALVTAIGSFAGDIVIKSLKKIGFKVIGCDIYEKEWIVDAYQVNEFYQAPYASQMESYIYFIKNICIKENIRYIIPLTDAEVDVFNVNRDWFIERNIRICISSKETIELCRNKNALVQFINEHPCVKTIPTQLLKNAIDGPIDYPVICKPLNGRSSQGLKYIDNAFEWKCFLKTADIDNYIVQPYIKGDIVTVDVIRQPEEKYVVTIARKELLRTLNGAGTSVYVFDDRELNKQCVDLANMLNVIGCVNFEFIVDSNNDYHFIECNPRFSGGIEFSFLAGYDCVSNHIKCFNNDNIDKFRYVHNQYIARKFEEYVTHIESKE